MYDPGIGRFLSADPFVQAPYDSQSLNRYSYVFNNPLSFTDPSGFLTAPPNPDNANPNRPPPTWRGDPWNWFRARINWQDICGMLCDQRRPLTPVPTGSPSGDPSKISTVGGNSIGVLYDGVAYTVTKELMGGFSCGKLGECQTQLVVRPDCNVYVDYKHSSCDAVYPSYAIENTLLLGVGAVSVARAAIAASAPEAVIARLAQAHANSGRQALAAYMSDLEAAAVQAGSRATPAILGQAAHTATARSLAQIYPGKYLYFPRAPYDFVYVPTGQIFELTTFGQAGSHAARGANLIFYTMPR